MWRLEFKGLNVETQRIVKKQLQHPKVKVMM